MATIAQQNAAPGSQKEAETKDVQSIGVVSCKPSPKLTRLHNYWVFSRCVPRVEAFQQNFQPRDGDIWLASAPKTGTTWTKALLHCIVSVACSTPDAIHLYPPRALVPNIELNEERAEAEVLPCRVLHTHLPFHGLPLTLQTCSSKLIYVSRNPRDTFVSFWNFRRRIEESEEFLAANQTTAANSKEDYFDAFCRGLFQGGPLLEHILSYWRAHKENPEKVFWLRYEDLQADCVGCVVKIARFLGVPSDVIESKASEIVEKCSFESLSNTEVNKTGVGKGSSAPIPLHNAFFFREGKSGGWRNHFNPEMEDRIRNEIELKLEEEGIHFQY